MAQSDGRADLSVTDERSRFTCHESMYVAGNAVRAGGHDANVMVGPGATLTVGDCLRIWKQGVVSVNGGTLDVQTLDVAAGGTIDWRGGVMVCRGTAHLKGQLDLSNNADIAGAIGQRLTVLTYDKHVGKLQIVVLRRRSWSRRNMAKKNSRSRLALSPRLDP